MSRMRGEGRRSRAAVLVAAIAAASLVSAGCALLVVGEARVKAIPGLTIAVFGTFLTSMAIIAAFSIEDGSRWPTPWEALDRAYVPAWFSVALGSVVTALLADAFDSAFLSTLSLTLALVAIPLGTWALWGLISLSSDRGRWRLVVDLLADSIVARGKLPDERADTDLGEIELEDHVPGRFLTAGLPRQPRRTGVSLEQVPGVLRVYADRRDLRAVVGLVDEVHAGACAAFERGGWADADGYLASVDALLSVQREVFAELAGRVLSGQLGDATARLALARAGEAFLDTAGRARTSGLDPAAVGAPIAAGDGRLEALLARHLTAISRFAGATTQEAEERLRHRGVPGKHGDDQGAMAILRGVCHDLQQAIRWAVDPDPPGMKLPLDHVWRQGLADPAAVLIWLWSTVESASGPYGVGLYAACEIITGRKFYENYWDGFDVFTEVARRLATGDLGVAAGRAALDRAGGLDTVALELGARRLAAMPPRAHDGEAVAEDPAHYDDRHVACNIFLAGAGYKPLGRDPVEDLAWLLTDRLSGSLWTAVADALSELSDPAASPPLRPLHRRPEACALCVALRLAPLEEEPGEGLGPLRGFLALLPDRLLEQTADLAAALTGIEPSAGGPWREAHEEAVVAACRFARHVTPGELPAQERLRLPRPAPAPTPRAAEGPDPGFVAAIAEISGAGAPVEVDLVQCDPRWLDEWAAPRAELDAALLAATLRGAARVRRVILYNLPPDSPPRRTRLRYRWNAALAAAVDCFRGDGEIGVPYEVRLLIPSEAEPGNGRVPADRIAVRPSGEDAEPSFESFWTRLDSELDPLDGPGLIEL
jgi:hypothetical protein